MHGVHTVVIGVVMAQADAGRPLVYGTIDEDKTAAAGRIRCNQPGSRIHRHDGIGQGRIVRAISVIGHKDINAQTVNNDSTRSAVVVYPSAHSIETGIGGLAEVNDEIDEYRGYGIVVALTAACGKKKAA